MHYYNLFLSIVGHTTLSDLLGNLHGCQILGAIS